MQVRSLGQEDLERVMATHSSILDWEILWTEETGGLQSVGLQKSWIRLNDKTTTKKFIQLYGWTAKWNTWGFL